MGPYQLIEPIGQGGVGRVWRATETDPNGIERTVAVKLLLEARTDKRIVEQFVQEARLVAAFDHQNIAAIRDWGQIDEQWYIAMELVEGHDLRQILVHAGRQKVKLPLSYAIHIVRQVGAALAHAHDARDADGRRLKVVHMDVSPANILIRTDGAVKLTDFGLAKSRLEQGTMGRQHVRGKLPYMSPEQVSGIPLDRRSDVFALGTVLFETATVERLWRRRTIEQTAAAVRQADLEPRLDAHPKLDPIKDVLRKALARDREERYPGCPEMIADLDAILARLGPLDPVAMGADLEALCRRAIQTTGPVEAAGSLPSPGARVEQKRRRLDATVDIGLGKPTFRGTLTMQSWLRALAQFAITRATGRLRAMHKGKIRDVFLRRGKLAYITSDDARSDLMSYLVEHNQIDKPTAADVWDHAMAKDRDVTRELLERKLVEPVTLSRSLKRLQIRRFTEPMAWVGGRFEWFDRHRPPPYVLPVELGGIRVLKRIVQKRLRERHVTALLDEMAGPHTAVSLVEPTPLPHEEIDPSSLELRVLAALKDRPMAVGVLTIGHAPEDAERLRRFVLLLLLTGQAVASG